MTHAISKKRPRHCEMDCVDELPISKKLHLLSIDSSNEFSSSCGTNSITIHCTNSHGHLTESNREICGKREPTDQTNGISETVYSSSAPPYSLLRQSNTFPQAQYNPSLDECDNPEYFHINRILFEAHKARMTAKDVK